MINDFIIYTVNKCFKGYFYTLSIFSLCIIVMVASLTKFLVWLIKPDILLNKVINASFQLSIFLFIPLLAYFIIRKYKYNELMRNQLSVKNIPFGLCIFFTILILLLIAILFTYLLVL